MLISVEKKGRNRGQTNNCRPLGLEPINFESLIAGRETKHQYFAAQKMLAVAFRHRISWKCQSTSPVLCRFLDMATRYPSCPHFRPKKPGFLRTSSWATPLRPANVRWCQRETPQRRGWEHQDTWILWDVPSSMPWNLELLSYLHSLLTSTWLFGRKMNPNLEISNFGVVLCPIKMIMLRTKESNFPRKPIKKS